MNALLLYWKPLVGALVLGFVLYAVYTAGGNAVRVAYEKRDTEAANQYAKALTEANTKLRAAEERSAELLAAADADYQAKLKETQNALNAALTRSHVSGLYVNAACPKVGGSSLPETSSGTSVDNGAERVKLSTSDGDFFIRFANECDGVADQLRAAQQVITADRK